jgi:hypothetical protein
MPPMDPLIDPLRERRLAALDAAVAELVQEGLISSLSDWCNKAGVSSGSVYDFKAGKSRLMRDATLAKMCTWANRPIDWIKGEMPITENPLVQRAIDLLTSLPPSVQSEFLSILEGRVMLQMFEARLGSQRDKS